MARRKCRRIRGKIWRSFRSLRPPLRQFKQTHESKQPQRYFERESRSAGPRSTDPRLDGSLLSVDSARGSLETAWLTRALTGHRGGGAAIGSDRQPATTGESRRSAPRESSGRHRKPSWRWFRESITIAGRGVYFICRHVMVIRLFV
ncbi:hypothetical protein MRX96_052963 [Rhipicephalus microplus]